MKRLVKFSIVFVLVGIAGMAVGKLLKGCQKTNPSEAQKVEISARKAEIADIRRQHQGAKRGDIILYKDHSLCCITFVNAETFGCIRFPGAVQETFLISNNNTMSKIMHIVMFEDPTDSNHDSYKSFALRYLQQPLPH